ncbi:MAG: DNA primase [Candidatus Pacebacteria bacterium]|nr:DNA primase [Candidatus Paceibacterota bacterium]
MINSPVQKIKERLTIEDVVSSYIKLEKSGASFKARCPFHNEKTPSFYVSPDRGSYYCFGCSSKGDIFSFVEEFEGLDFRGALKLLAARAGVPLENYNKEEESEKDRLYKAMEVATIFFSGNLNQNQEVLNYLHSRGLTDDSIKNFRIGYVPADWRLLYAHLQSKGFKDQEIEKAGLAKKSEKSASGGGSTMYDRFRGRVMFPIADSSGRIIAFSGRIFVDDGKSAKYLNSPDTPIFSKSAVLYGLDKAKESIRKNNFSILVEGQMDLVLSHQAGFKNTIATSGTALSDSTVDRDNAVSNLGLVRRLSPNIVLAFDADNAGLKASGRAGKIALSLGMDVKVASLPKGVDPADLISKEGTDAWKGAIRESKHLIEFILNKILESSGGDNRKVGREIKERVLPYVEALDSSIEKMHFIKKISDATSIPESALKDDLKKVEAELGVSLEVAEIKVVEAQKFRKDYIERRLLGVILWQQTIGDVSKKVLDTENLLIELAEILKTTPEELLNKNKNNKEDLVFEAEIFYGEGVNIEKDVGELMSNLREEYLKEDLSRKMQDLHVAEEKKEQERATQILQDINEINKKIQNIKSGQINNN